MTNEEILQATKLFLLDLDGTVYLGDRIIGEMDQTLHTLREMGKRIVFLTNNSSRTRAAYEEKLKLLHLFEEGDGVYTSAMAMAEYLRTNHTGERAYIVATAAVEEEIRRSGIPAPLPGRQPDLCVLAYDTELTFEKLRLLDRYMKERVPLYVTHPDDVCPTPYGSMPDVGSFLALLRRSSGQEPELVLGKPFPHMGKCLARETGIPMGEMCMVGDRLHTDIRFANNCKMHSVLVLSGEAKMGDVSRFTDCPDLILPDFNRILD